MKVTERIRAFAISPFLLASFAISKERTRAPAQFPVVKGPIRRQTLRAKQAGDFLLFNCPTLISQRLRDVTLQHP